MNLFAQHPALELWRSPFLMPFAIASMSHPSPPTVFGFHQRARDADGPDSLLVVESTPEQLCALPRVPVSTSRSRYALPEPNPPLASAAITWWARTNSSGGMGGAIGSGVTGQRACQRTPQSDRNLSSPTQEGARWEDGCPTRELEMGPNSSSQGAGQGFSSPRLRTPATFRWPLLPLRHCSQHGVAFLFSLITNSFRSTPPSPPLPYQACNLQPHLPKPPTHLALTASRVLVMYGKPDLSSSGWRLPALSAAPPRRGWG
jgi:hypothetical protein